MAFELNKEEVATEATNATMTEEQKVALLKEVELEGGIIVSETVNNLVIAAGLTVDKIDRELSEALDAGSDEFNAAVKEAMISLVSTTDSSSLGIEEKKQLIINLLTTTITPIAVRIVSEVIADYKTANEKVEETVKEDTSPADDIEDILSGVNSAFESIMNDIKAENAKAEEANTKAEEEAKESTSSSSGGGGSNNDDGWGWGGWLLAAAAAAGVGYLGYKVMSSDSDDVTLVDLSGNSDASVHGW